MLFLISLEVADAAEVLAPCGPKTKGKLSQLEKKSSGFLAKVDSFKSKSEGRAPASFCTDGHTKKAALLAQEGVAFAEEFESIEKTVGGECTALAANGRTKVETVYLDLNRSYIQSCPHGF